MANPYLPSWEYIPDIIPVSETEQGFFEACSMRKVGDTYYLIYSPKRGCRLDYMTSSSPTGPFTYGGTIIDNGVDYPGGNDHGSITSRRACVEKIELLPDGSIPEVEMTSLGFETSLNPYDITPAEIACVLKGNLFITEHNPFTRVITNIKKNAVIGYKYFDFGQDYSSKTMEFSVKVTGAGCESVLNIYIDGEEGTKIGSCEIGSSSGVYSCIVDAVVGRHSIYFVVDYHYSGWFETLFSQRNLFDFESFV